jgi:hypothetical protein
MPVSGINQVTKSDLSSSFDRDFEKVTPYHYQVLLDNGYITVDFAPTERCGFFQFSPESTKELVLVFQTIEDGTFNLKGNQNLIGEESVKGATQHVNIWFNDRRTIRLCR